MSEALDRYKWHALAVLRIVTALIFIPHGMQKLFGFPTPPGRRVATHLLPVLDRAVIELAGGILISAATRT